MQSVGEHKGDRFTGMIEPDCSFEGSLTFNGVFRIAGRMNGTIFTNGTLIVAEGAVVSAEIFAKIVVISGRVKGKIEASGRVEMKSPASFDGEVHTPSLIVEDGVQFHGSTHISD